MSLSKNAAADIDLIIQKHGGWKGEIVVKIRTAVLSAGPLITEEVKWRMASRPEGLPVWSHNGIVCFAEIWKDNVKLLFPNGAHLDRLQQHFNARLNSKDIRAIEYRQNDPVDSKVLKALVSAAAGFNSLKK